MAEQPQSTGDAGVALIKSLKGSGLRNTGMLWVNGPSDMVI